MNHRGVPRILSRWLVPTLVVVAVLASGAFLVALPAPARAAAQTGLRPSSLWRRTPGLPLRKGGSTPGLSLPCQSQGALPRCYTPAQIVAAYEATPLFRAGIDGRGQAITIIDASSDPSLIADLHAFDQAFGLPDPGVHRVYHPFVF